MADEQTSNGNSGSSLVVKPEIIKTTVIRPRQDYSKKPIVGQMRRHMLEHPEELQEMVQMLFAMARAGSLPAIQLVMERIEGKAIQQLILTEDEPYNFSMEINFAGTCPHCGKELSD